VDKGSQVGTGNLADKDNLAGMGSLVLVLVLVLDLGHRSRNYSCTGQDSMCRHNSHRRLRNLRSCRSCHSCRSFLYHSCRSSLFQVMEMAEWGPELELGKGLVGMDSMVDKDSLVGMGNLGLVLGLGPELGLG